MNKIANHPLVVSLRSKFDAMPQRDQRAIAILGLACAIGLPYFAVYYPIQQWHASSVAEYQDTLDSYNWLVDQSGKVKAIQQNSQQAQSNSSGQSMSGLVTTAANSANLQLASLESLADNRVRFRIDNAQMSTVMTMVGGLVLTEGVAISSARIDQGNAPGIVTVLMDLSR